MLLVKSLSSSSPRLRRAHLGVCVSGSRKTSRKSSDPLHILFCGADEFSGTCLKALNAERMESPELIKSIQVVCKEPKRHGRGLKRYREGR